MYEDYHTHPINKMIHVICIPLIVLTSSIFLSLIKVRLLDAELNEIVAFFILTNYLYKYGIVTSLIMLIYFFCLITLL